MKKLIGKKIPVIKNYTFHADNFVEQKCNSNTNLFLQIQKKPKSQKTASSRSKNNKKNPFENISITDIKN